MITIPLKKIKKKLYSEKTAKKADLVPTYEHCRTAEERALMRERATHEFRTTTGEHIRYQAPKLWEN